MEQNSNDGKNHQNSKSPAVINADVTPPRRTGVLKDNSETTNRRDNSTTPLSMNGDNQEDETEEQIIMREKLELNIADTAQPTVEEIKEYESFSSKYEIVTITDYL